jgi:hypothetical protein
VRIRSGYKTFVLLTLLLWLMTSWTGVHAHFCFDGQEPPISPRLDVIGGHEVHTADESHQDIDVEVSQSVLAKLLKFDPSLPILLAVIFILLAVTHTPLFFFLHRRSSSPSSRGDSSAAARTSCNSILIVVNGPL